MVGHAQGLLLHVNLLLWELLQPMAFEMLDHFGHGLGVLLKTDVEICMLSLSLSLGCWI